MHKVSNIYTHYKPVMLALLQRTVDQSLQVLSQVTRKLPSQEAVPWDEKIGRKL